MKSLATYAYLNALLRARLSKRLSERQMGAIAGAADLIGVASLLKETDYASISTLLESEAPPKAVEKAIMMIEIARYRDLLKYVKDPVRAFVFILMEMYDVEKVEGTLRLWREKAWEERDTLIEQTICVDIPVGDLLKASSIEEFISLLDETPYIKPLFSAYKRYRRSGFLFTLETAIETDYYRRLWDRVQELSRLDRSAATRLLGLEIDIRNIEILTRLMRYSDIPAGELAGILLPGGSRLNEKLLLNAYSSKDTRILLDSLRTASRIPPAPLHAARGTIDQLRFLQAFLEEMLRAAARYALSGFPFTIGTVLGYLALGRSEARSLRRIIVGKYLGLPADRITRATGIGNSKL